MRTYLRSYLKTLIKSHVAVAIIEPSEIIQGGEESKVKEL